MDPGIPRLLLVEPDGVARAALTEVATPFAAVVRSCRFETARERLLHTPFDYLVTNVRLGAYNGLHLVYLGASVPGGPRAIVYSDQHDAALAREIQQSGAFYEIGTSLPLTLTAYLRATLPGHDRRDVRMADRRKLGRGSRRQRDAPFNPCAINSVEEHWKET
jgi:hypothetical protein